MIFDFSECDGVELWLKDHGKYFRCETDRFHGKPSFVENTPIVRGADGEISPAPGEEPDLIRLCFDIIDSKFDSSLPFVTAKGSFWTGNARDHGLRTREDYKSLAIFPLIVENQDVGLLQLKSGPVDFFSKDKIVLFEGLAQTLGIAMANRRAQVDLRERVKELTCLSGIARLVARPGISLDEILQGIVELLPQAWLYPEITFSRITWNGRTYEAPGFREGVSRQSVDVVVDGEIIGGLEVFYSEQKPELDEGPFLKEERNLIDTVAREVATIIKRKQAENDRLELQEQLRHADRLTTIGQLAAGVAHELNEPLGSILGFAQLAKKCPRLPRQAEEDLDKIVDASLYAREIVKKLLIFARQMPPRKAPINMNQIVESSLYLLKSRCAGEGVELLCSLAPNLPLVHADPTQFNQVMVNLVMNGLHAMPDGGRLTIQTLVQNDFLVLIVEDTGVGMDEEVRKKIFTPFFTTKEVGQGTGLGLSVVHGIVTSHGGSIQVESKPGRGTRFEIRLPLAASRGNSGE
jgi:signal transduction histidine kinase